MKIANHHRQQGDTVEWLNHFEKYEKVYKSKVFTFTPDNLIAVQSDEIFKGGTGYKMYNDLFCDDTEQAYHDLNRMLGSFYEQPREQSRENPETERLIAELEALQSQLDEAASRSISMDNQLELMERSFEMAARFMPNSGTPPASVQAGNMGTTVQMQETTPTTGNNVSVVPVSGVREQVVSALSQPMSNIEFMKAYSQERNMGFHSAIADAQTVGRNTIRASIHDDQTVVVDYFSANCYTDHFSQMHRFL